MLKGDLRKASILAEAKKQFWEKGYTAIRIKDITDALGLQTSWVSYYFKTKDNIVSEIAKQVSQKVENRIEQKGIVIDNPLLFFLVRARLLYYISLKDGNNRRYRYEITQQNATLRSSGVYNLQKYYEIMNYYGIEIADDRYDMLQEIYTAARNKLLLSYLDGKYSFLSFEEMISATEKIFPIALGIPIDVVDSLMEESICICKQIDVSDIDQLK